MAGIADRSAQQRLGSTLVIRDRPQPLTEEEFDAIVDDQIKAAERHVDSKIRPEREDIWRRYYGRVTAQVEDGGSDVVVTSIEDSVTTILPDLLALYMGSDRIVEYLPGSNDPVEREVATGATDAGIALFWDIGGFKALHDAAHESLTTGYGFVKVFKHEKIVPKWAKEILSPEDVEIRSLEAQVTPTGNEDNPDEHEVMTYEVESSLRIQAVAASNMIWTYSDSFDESWCIGEVVEMRLGDLVALGFDSEQLIDIDAEVGQTTRLRGEKDAREDYSTTTVNKDETGALSWAQRRVNYYETYQRIDQDGDGLVELYKVMAAGHNKKVLRRTRVDHHPYCFVPTYSVPHSSYSRGVGQRLRNMQEQETRVARAIQDDVDLSSGPMILVARAAKVDEDQIGVWKKRKIIDCEMPDGVKWLEHPSAAQALMAVQQALETMREQKVGISQIAAGLNIENMSELTATLTRGVLSAAQRKLDYIARVQSEEGIVPIFTKLLKLMIEEGSITVQLNNKTMQLDTRMFNPRWKVRAKVGLGLSGKAEKLQAFTELYGVLKDILTNLGEDNEVTDLSKLANLIRDYGKMHPGLNVDRYVKSVDEAEAFKAKKAQNPTPPDPETMKVQADIQLNQQKFQTDTQLRQAKLQGDSQLAQQKAQADIQLKQQKLQQDATRAMAELQQAYEETATKLQQDYELKMAEMGLEGHLTAQEMGIDQRLREQEIEHKAKADMVKAKQSKVSNTNIRKPH
jgi:hypothetical protein